MVSQSLDNDDYKPLYLKTAKGHAKKTVSHIQLSCTGRAAVLSPGVCQAPQSLTPSPAHHRVAVEF